MHNPKTIKTKKPKTVVTPQLLGECSRTQTLLFLLPDLYLILSSALGQAPITSGCCSVWPFHMERKASFCPKQSTSLAVVGGKKCS